MCNYDYELIGKTRGSLLNMQLYIGFNFQNRGYIHSFYTVINERFWTSLLLQMFLQITDLTDLRYILKCTPMDISLSTGLSVCRDFSHVHLEMKDTEILERTNRRQTSYSFINTTHLKAFCLGCTPELIEMLNPVINCI